MVGVFILLISIRTVCHSFAFDIRRPIARPELREPIGWTAGGIRGTKEVCLLPSFAKKRLSEPAIDCGALTPSLHHMYDRPSRASLMRPPLFSRPRDLGDRDFGGHLSLSDRKHDALSVGEEDYLARCVRLGRMVQETEASIRQNVLTDTASEATSKATSTRTLIQGGIPAIVEDTGGKAFTIIESPSLRGRRATSPSASAVALGIGQLGTGKSTASTTRFTSTITTTKGRRSSTVRPGRKPSRTSSALSPSSPSMVCGSTGSVEDLVDLPIPTSSVDTTTKPQTAPQDIDIDELVAAALNTTAPVIRAIRYNATIAAERLLASHERLIFSIAHRYRGKGVAFDDILSAARRGFINALNRFDGAFYGTRLSTYATVWIKQACQQCLSRNSRFIKLGNANQIILNAIHRLRHSNTNFAPPTATPTSSSSSSDTSLNGSASSRRKRGDSTTSTAATTGLTTTYDTAKEMPSPSSPSSSASSTPISRSPYPEAAALATELGVPVAKVIRALRAQERDFAISSAETPLYEGRSNSKNAGTRSRGVLGESAAVGLGEGDAMEEGDDMEGGEEEFGDDLDSMDGEGNGESAWDTHFDSVSEFGSRLRQGMASEEEAEGYKDIDSDFLDEDLDSGDHDGFDDEVSSPTAKEDDDGDGLGLYDALSDEDGDDRLEDAEEEEDIGLALDGGRGSTSSSSGSSIICVDGESTEEAENEEEFLDGIILDDVESSNDNHNGQRSGGRKSTSLGASDSSRGSVADDLHEYLPIDVMSKNVRGSLDSDMPGTRSASAGRSSKGRSNMVRISSASDDSGGTIASEERSTATRRDPRNPLRAELAVLTPTETRIVQMRYGLATIGPRGGNSMGEEPHSEPMSFTAIARVLGMTRQRVCQLEASAVAKMVAVGSLHHPDQTFRASSRTMEAAVERWKAKLGGERTTAKGSKQRTVAATSRDSSNIDDDALAATGGGGDRVNVGSMGERRARTSSTTGVTSGSGGSVGSGGAKWR